MAETDRRLRRLSGWRECTSVAALIVIAICLLCSRSNSGQNAKHSDLIKQSRESCVRVSTVSGNSYGSGFFVDPNHVVTCCHVITKECSFDQNGLVPVHDPNKLNLRWQAFSDITVETSSGESIPAKCISVPTSVDPSPLLRDFAVLRLETKPSRRNATLPFSQDSSRSEVGDEVYFSGFPLGAPVMLTHKGMLSGISNERRLLCIQAPINKGNSGGALLNVQGEVIGIVSNREGGISRELDRIRKQIVDVEQQKKGSVSFFGVNPLASQREIISVLNQYISTGIGYARSTSDVRDYITKRTLLPPGNGDD